jgi:hypothetical protein
VIFDKLLVCDSGRIMMARVCDFDLLNLSNYFMIKLAGLPVAVSMQLMHENYFI